MVIIIIHHSVDVINFALAQSNHNKRLLQYNLKKNVIADETALCDHFVQNYISQMITITVDFYSM